MATATSGKHDHLEKLSWYLAQCPHDVWNKFSAEQQEKMVEDDLCAATNVSMILGSVITAGLVLSIITLAVVLIAS